MPDDYLANPWDASATGQPTTDPAVLATPAVEGADPQGPSGQETVKRSAPDPIILPNKPPICKQEGPRCWAASMASWKAVRGFQPAGGGTYPADTFDFETYAKPFLDKYAKKGFVKPNGSLMPENWPAVAADEGLDWCEGYLNLGSNVFTIIGSFSYFLKERGHIYCVYSEKGANMAHVVVVYGTQRYQSMSGIPLTSVWYMDPWTGKHENVSEPGFFTHETYYHLAVQGTGKQMDWPNFA